MAQNLRDRGYSSSMDNYNQQKKKKQTQQGPVSQKKEVYGPPASAAPNALQQKFHSRQTTVAPGTATVQKGNRVSGRSVGTIGTGKQIVPAPVSTQRISTVGYDRAASAFTSGKLSETEFNRSPAMQKSYGTYDNYTRGARVTGGGFYHMDTPDFTGMQAAQSQYEQAYETIMGNLARTEKRLETAAGMQGPLRPDQEVARGRAVEDYLKARDAAERFISDYQTMRQEYERAESAFQTENEKWRSTIREMGEIQQERDRKEQEIRTLQQKKDTLLAQSASANTRGQADARNTGTMDAGTLENIMNTRDDISRIDRQIRNLREDQALLDEEMEWSRYFRWQGFVDQNIPVSAQRANGGQNLLENEADYRTRFNQAVEERSGIRSRAREGVNRLGSDAQMTSYMTMDERTIYEKLYRQQGPKIAQQYFDELRSMDLNTRRRIREEDALRAAVRDDPIGVGTVGMNLMTVLLKPYQAASFLGQTAEMLTTGKMTKDAAYNRALYMSNAVRGETGAEINEAVSRKFGESWGKWGEFGYQTGMSMLDFLYNTWLTGGFGVDKGALAAYQGGARTAEALAAGRAYKAAEQFGLLLMSSEAAADTTMQAKDRGLSDSQSYALGCIAGAAEYVTEKISLENLLDMVNAGGGVKEQIWYALKNRIAEASEEGASDMINLFADILITKDKSEWQTAIRAYQAQGLSENEAFIKALTDQAEQTGMSMAGGWLSGGTMSNVMLGLNAGRNYIQNRDTITGANYVGSIIRQAEGLKEGSAGYQAAQALQARLDAGERPSVREVLNAQKRIDTERRTDRKYVRTQIREAERYEGTEAAEQAEALREKLARGEEASIREVNRLEDALDEARATDPETLRPVIAQGMAGEPDSEAYRTAQKLQEKLDAGQRITLKEAARASQTIQTAVEQDLQSQSAEAIGRRLVTEDGQAALAEAADTVAAYGNAEMQTRAAEIREQMRTGEIDARTAGEVFLESERIWNRQQERAANTRVLQPREVTEEMTELERTAAQIGVSEQETARVKAVADLLDADVRYFSEEAERFQRDGRNLIRTKNGYYDKATGTIWLNAQSTNPVMTVLSHELTHSLEVTESYGEFRKLVLSMAGELRSTIEQTYESQNLDPEDIDHEVVARYVEEHLLTDEAAIRDAVQRNRSFGQWMRDQLDKVLAKLGNEDARERVTLQKARDLYAQALKEKAASRGETDGRLRLPKVKNETNVNKVQFSFTEEIRDENIRTVATMKPVAELSGEEFLPGSIDLITQVSSFFDSIGNSVDTRQIGAVALNRRGIKTDIGHGIGRNKAAAFQAVPAILKNGEVIDYAVNWKNRNYDTVVFAAPITIAGEPYMAGVIALKDSNGSRFYLHEVLIEKEGQTPFKTGTNNSASVPGGAYPSLISLLRKVVDVKNNIGKAGNTQSSMTEETAEPEGLALPAVGEETKAAKDLRRSGIETKDGAVAYNLTTYEESDVWTDQKMVARQIAKAIGISERKANRYLNSLRNVAYQIARDRARLDYDSAPGLSAFVSNVEYGGSFDFTTLCTKRRYMTGTMAAIQKNFDDRGLTAEEFLTIRRMLEDAGYQVSCPMCYVEGSRAKLGEYAGQFRKTINGEKPTVSQLTDPVQLEELRKENPEMYRQWEQFLNRMNQRKPKMYQARTAYAGEILREFTSAEDVAQKNRNGGIRFQSFSDFEAVHLLDNMQVIADMARVGLAGQAYTKMIDYVMAMGGTGLKINMSLVARGVDANGRIILDETAGMTEAEVERARNAYAEPVEGMDEETRQALRESFSRNVGTILVVFDDAQLRAALADDRIDFVIPYHRSQWAKAQHYLMGMPKGSMDFTHLQNEKDFDEVSMKTGKRVAQNLVPADYWESWMTGREAAEAYLRKCFETGRVPKFSRILQKNADGSFSLQENGSTDGYWKLLSDYKMYDNDGNYAPQIPVQPLFDDSTLENILEREEGGESYPAAQEVVDRFMALKEKRGGREVRLQDYLGKKKANALKAEYAEMQKQRGKIKDKAGLWSQSAETQNQAYQYSATEEEEGPLGLQLPRTDAEQRIRRDAPEEERYEILKDKKLTAKPYNKSKLEDVDLSKFETLNRTETEKLLRKIGEQFGVFKKYRTQDVAVEFQFSRNNLGESVHKQGGRYSDYAKMLTVFDDVIENAVGIETHSERYDNPGSPLTQMYVLASAFKTEDGVIPVLMEVKEFSNGTRSSLHLTISLNAIAEADIVAYVHAPEEGTMSYTPSASEYSIADIFKNVNIKDGELLKYIPDGFLTDEQKAAKQKALERTEQYIAEKNRRKYSQSITEEEDMGLRLPKVEDETEASGDASLREAEAQAEAPARKKTKPVAESKPIEARRWLNRQTIDKFGIPEGKRKAAAETVQRYADKMIERGEVTEQDVAELFNALLYEGVVDVVPDDYSRTMREIVTGGKIHASASVKADFGDDWNAFRKRAFAAGLMLTNTSPTESGKVMGIDMIWHELSEMSPGLFPADEYDPRAQLEKIVQAAEQGMKQQLTLPEYLAHMNKTEGLDMYETADRMMAELAQDFKTFGEMAKLEVKLRDRTGVKIAQERERFGEIRDKEFRKAEKIRKEERARFRETQQRARERRQISELQQKTLKQLQWLSKNRLRAPEELRGTWDELLGNLDIYAVHAADETHYSKKHEATYRDIISMYKEARANDPNFLPSKELERIMSRVDGEHLEDLDVDALRNLYQAITGLRTEFYNRNNAIMENETAALSDIFDETRAQMQAQRGYRDGFVSRILNEESLTPMNVLRRMVGWNRNSAWVQMARQLEQGEKIRRDYKVRAERLLEDFLNENKDWFTRADGIGKNAIWYEVQIPEFMEFGKGNKPIWGDTVTVWMTPLQKVHMYLESKSYDNLRHMLGGRTFADKALYEKGERARAFAAGTTVKLAPETVRSLVKDLSPEEMKLAKLLENYYNVWSKGRINEVSNRLYGYDKAMNANYAPILTNQNYVGKELGVGDATAAGVGNLKARIYSKNPSYNVSAIEAFERSVDQTGKFVGYAIAESNWQKLLNWQVRGDSMRDVITHTWDKQSLDYIENLIETLQGNRRRDGKLVLGESTNKLLSNYISAVFGANPGIVLKQAASFPQFAAVLGWTTAPNLKQLAKVDTALINTYTSELAYRQMGYATPETAQLKNNPGILQRNKALNFLFGGGAITAMDAATVKRGWAWAENYVRKNFPALEIGTKEQIEAGESEFYKKVAEVFEDAVSTTQPMYDEMHRPYIMKEANGIARAFTMFKTVPLQQYNTLRRMWGEYDAARKAYSADQSAENKEALRKAAWGAANSVTATIGSVLGLELVELLNALWKNRGKKYRDDDDELTAQSIGTQAAIQAAEDLMGMVPAGKELAQFLENLFMGKKWYGIEIPGGEQLNDFIDLIGDTYKQTTAFVTGLADIVRNGEDWKLYMRRHAGEYAAAVKTLIEKTGMYFGGLPLENLEKYIMGGVQFSPELSQAIENAFGYTDRSKLNGKTGAQLEKGVTDLFGLRGMQISEETAAAIGTLFENGNRDAVPQDTPDSLTIDGESVKLTESQKQRWERTWSQTGREVDALVESDAFKNADDETKARMLNKLYELARIEANKTVPGWKTDSKLPENVKTITDGGGTVADAAAWYGMTGRQGIKDAEKMQILADMDVSEQVKEAIFRAEKGDRTASDDGTLTAFGKLKAAQEAGLSVTQYTGFIAELGDSGVSDPDTYRVLAKQKLSDDQKAALFGTLGTPDEDGTQRQERMEFVRSAGMKVDDYLKWCETECTQANKGEKLRALADADMSDRDRKIILSSLFSNRDTYQRDGQKTDYAKMQELINAGMPVEDYCTVAADEALTEYVNAVNGGVPREYCVEAARVAREVKDRTNEQRYEQGLPTGDWVDYCVEALQLPDRNQKKMAVAALMNPSDWEKCQACIEHVTPNYYIQAQYLWKQLQQSYMDAHPGEKKPSMNQEYAKMVVDRIDCSQEQKAYLFNMFNKSWKKNPYGNYGSYAALNPAADDEPKGLTLPYIEN